MIEPVGEVPDIGRGKSPTDVKHLESQETEKMNGMMLLRTMDFVKIRRIKQKEMKKYERMDFLANGRCYPIPGSFGGGGGISVRMNSAFRVPQPQWF
jgi:hypothetical protein